MKPTLLQRIHRHGLRGSLIALLCFAGAGVQAAGYRALDEVAILYDAPSTKGIKRYIAPAGMPVQIVVALDAWVKVRDVNGDLAWVERKAVGDKAMLVTVAHTSVRQAPNDMAAEVFQIDKGVLLELMEAPNTPSIVPPRNASTVPAGWAQVRHVDGQSGFIKVVDVWGL